MLNIGKDAAYEGINGWKFAFFPRQSRHFLFLVTMIEVLFPVSTLTWRVHIHVFRHGKSIYRRNENTTFQISENSFPYLTITWLYILWLVVHVNSHFFVIHNNFVIFVFWETIESWQFFQEKHRGNILGTAGHETGPFLESTRNTSHKFLKRLKMELLNSCPRNSVS